VSAKQAQPNFYAELKAQRSAGDEVAFTVTEVVVDRVRVDVSLDNGSTAQGYIHKSELSDLVFVTDTNISDFLPIGGRAFALIKRFDDGHHLVELSRKSAFRLHHDDLQYGTEYDGQIVATGARGAVVQTDRHEGIAVGDRNRVRTRVSIHLARKGSDPRSTEFAADS
jgi:hypothetical protein